MQRRGAVLLILTGAIAALLFASVYFSGTGLSGATPDPVTAVPVFTGPAGNTTSISPGYRTGPALPRFYRDLVPAGTGRQWIDVSWTDPAQPRTLMVYSPDGTLGPLYNSNNGRIDQRIYLLVENNTSLPAGPWYYEIRTENGTMNNNQSFLIVREPAGTGAGGI